MTSTPASGHSRTWFSPSPERLPHPPPGHHLTHTAASHKLQPRPLPPRPRILPHAIHTISLRSPRSRRSQACSHHELELCSAAVWQQGRAVSEHRRAQLQLPPIQASLHATQLTPQHIHTLSRLLTSTSLLLPPRPRSSSQPLPKLHPDSPSTATTTDQPQAASKPAT